MHIYDINHRYELQIKNRSECGLRSREASSAIVEKAQKKTEAPSGFEPITSVIPVRHWL